MRYFNFKKVLEIACILTITLFFLMPTAFHSGGNSNGDLPRPMAPDFVITINVTNTLTVERINEVIQFNVTLPDSVITDSTNFTVRRQSDNSEIMSGPLNSTVEYYPSGYIHRMRIAFQDNFTVGERKGYFIRVGEMTLFKGDMSYTIAPPYIIVNDGNTSDFRTYRIFTDHTINDWTTGVRVYYEHNTYPYQVQSGILVRVGGDQLDLDQTNFQMGWGVPDQIIVDSNNVMVSVHLLYKSPYAVQWGRGFPLTLVKDVDVIWADITVNFYNNNSIIDTYVSKKINEKFYNHNGFVMETSILLAGDGNYEYIFGNAEHTRQWANTTSLNWVWDQTKLVGLDVGNRSAPTAGDLDDDGDLDLIVGSLNGTLIGYRNIGNPTNPVYLEDVSLVPAGGPWDNCTSPVFSDLDNDIDLDLVVGLYNGTVISFKNVGSPASPSWIRDDSLVAGVNSLQVMSNAAPELADLDADGDFDLLIGQNNGTFLFFRNIGTVASPIWSKDDSEFDYLNQGLTLKPGTHAAPEITDVNRDGLIDFVSGVGYTTFGSLVYFENEATNTRPRFTRLYPAMFNNVRGGVYYDRDYSVPEFGDFNSDGLEDIVMGQNDGLMQLWINQGYTLSERHANTMQPLDNGSYRFYYDQDGNDGQYVIRNYSGNFDGWYVVSNPATNASILRYVPDFDRYAYRDCYSGEMYPWAGGNTSYYPFNPREDGRVGRGILITRAYSDSIAGGYGVGATYLSQTGTAGGFVQVPMTAINHNSREVMVVELPYDSTANLYESLAEQLKTPPRIDADSDLALRTLDITSNPTDPARGMNINLSAKIWNIGYNDTNNVRVDFFDGDPAAGGTPISIPQVIPIIQVGKWGSASVTWNTTSIIGPHEIFVVVDDLNAIIELDEDNNIASRLFNITAESRYWSEELMISQSDFNDMDPDMAVDALGRIWISWHTFVAKEDFDIYATYFDGVSWGTVETVAKGFKHTSAPALATSRDGDVWLLFSSNLDEYNRYIATKNAIYYWSQKFDLWGAKFSYDGWHPPERISYAIENNNSDQAPSAVFTNNGILWTAFRHTHFQLYTHGFQMYNIPYQDMNVSTRSFDGTLWSDEQIIDNSIGSQGWWAGSSLAVAPDNTIWAVYESEISQTQWELFASSNNGSGWNTPVRLTFDGGHDVRPASTFDSNGNLWIVWESDRTGNKDLYVKYFNGSSWSSDIQLTFDQGEDMKPSIFANMSGQILIAWESDRTGNKDIFLKVYNNSMWSPDFQVTTDPNSDEHVKVVGSPIGGALLAWESDRRGYGNKDIFVKGLSLHVPRRGPSNLKAELEGRSYQNVKLTWNLSVDDWMLGIVNNYIIKCGATYDPSGKTYTSVWIVPAGNNFKNISNRGHSDPNNLFCYVVADTIKGLSAISNQAGAYKIPLGGHDLVSVPLIMGNTHSANVFAPLINITSNFTYARYYDPTDTISHWKSFTITGPRNILKIDNSMGLWIGTTGPAQFTVAGVVPIQYRIEMKSGWNLVGYPSLTPRTVAEALPGLPVIKIEGFDSTCPPYSLKKMSWMEKMVPGQAYWIWLSSDATWLISG